MRRLLALIASLDNVCPSCDAAVVHNDGGFHACKRCGVVVDYARGGWRFKGESGFRRLPGLSGLVFAEPPAVRRAPAPAQWRPATRRMLLLTAGSGKAA